MNQAQKFLADAAKSNHAILSRHEGRWYLTLPSHLVSSFGDRVLFMKGQLRSDKRFIIRPATKEVINSLKLVMGERPLTGILVRQDNGDFKIALPNPVAIWLRLRPTDHDTVRFRTEYEREPSHIENALPPISCVTVYTDSPVR
mgnify:CR=1 FL=1|tara:strand:+ start:1593 stop:2024 length:432 start_codon:yes stop_codon:yes gene_type:complete